MITTEIRVEMQKIGIDLDITDRVMGCSISTTLEYGAMGTQECTLTLSNFDGAFTPGNGGTYDVDIFTYGFRVWAEVSDGTTTGDAILFAGSPTGFTIFDDGVTSTVELELADVFTIVGTAPVRADLAIPGVVIDFPYIDVVLTNLFQGLPYVPTGGFYLEPIRTPTFGSPGDSDLGFAFLGPSTDTGAILPIENARVVLDDIEDVGVGEVINTKLLPSGPYTAFPYSANFVGVGPIGLKKALITAAVTSKYGNREVNYLDPTKTLVVYMPFDESPTGDQLPFRALQRGYTIDELRNSAQITTASSTNEQDASDLESIAAYGVRNVQYDSVTLKTDADALDTSQRWANRHSTSRYVARSIEITDKMVAANSDDSARLKWEKLLSTNSGVYQYGTVTYTPTGASSSITEQVLTWSRVIDIVPGELRLTTELRPLVDYVSLLLDDTDIGVLDQNRLG